MNIINRTEFIDKFNDIMRSNGTDCGDDNHPLWLAEKFDPTNRIKCNWFVCVVPFTANAQYYWDWCNSTLAGQVACFSSDDHEQEEWWGFTNENDTLIWLLKWTK